MNSEGPEASGSVELDERLGALTRWDEARPRASHPAPWERAWAETWRGATTDRAREARLWALAKRPMSSGTKLSIAAILLLAVAVGLMLPSLRVPGQMGPAAHVPERARVGTGWKATGIPQDSLGLNGRLADADRRDGLYNFGPSETLGAYKVGEQSQPAASSSPETAPAPSIPAERSVVRRVNLDLTTPDVRGAFLKAQHVVSEARGEYVQDSSLTGSGKTAEATLTLRVAADRLGAVLGELRELGAVGSERATGEDVTTQVVDVDARLRNERRVEGELLQLLESRQTAPLKEILELRASLSDVRRTIEELAGQQQKLSRLVSLATVLVVIRTGEPTEPAKPDEHEGIWSYFATATGGAWHKGLTVLADTVAALLSLLVGGLIWWVLLATGAGLAWRAIRRRSAGAARPATPV